MTRSIQLAGAGLLLILLGAWLRIPDNPPAIFLLYSGCLALILALVLPWKYEGRFRLICIGGLIAFPVLVVLHNFLEASAIRMEDSLLIPWVLQALSVLSFLLAVLVSPLLVLVGMSGWLWQRWRQRA